MVGLNGTILYLVLLSPAGLSVSARWWMEVLISAYCGGNNDSTIAVHDGR